MSADTPRQPPPVDAYDDDLAALIVAYAEHLVMHGRVTALSAELNRIQRERIIADAELDLTGSTTDPALLFTRQEERLDQLIRVGEAIHAEMDAYATEILPDLHTLLDRVARHGRNGS